MTSKRYDENFKKKIVQLLFEGKTAVEIVEEYNISHTSIYTWAKQYNDIYEVSFKKYNEIQEENKRLKQEVDILKQAMSIMASK